MTGEPIRGGEGAPQEPMTQEERITRLENIAEQTLNGINTISEGMNNINTSLLAVVSALEASQQSAREAVGEPAVATASTEAAADSSDSSSLRQTITAGARTIISSAKEKVKMPHVPRRILALGGVAVLLAGSGTAVAVAANSANEGSLAGGEAETTATNPSTTATTPTVQEMVSNGVTLPGMTAPSTTTTETTPTTTYELDTEARPQSGIGPQADGYVMAPESNGTNHANQVNNNGDSPRPQAHKNREQRGEKERITKAHTVAGATKLMHSNKENLKNHLHLVFDTKSGSLKVDHDKNSVSSLRSQFSPEDITRFDGAEAVAFTAKNDPAFVDAVYKQMKGMSIWDQVPAGTSRQEMMKTIERVMTDEDTKFSIESPKDLWVLNHGQKNNNDPLFKANMLHLQGNIPVVMLTMPNGDQLMFKIVNGCLNPLEVVPAPTVTPSAPPSFTPSTPSTPGTPNVPGTPTTLTPSTPGTPETPTPTPQPTPGKPKPGTPPHKLKPGNPTPVTPGTPEKPTPPTPPGPKEDKNTNPGGNDGQNGGTPDVAGEGPAGQTPNPDGYLPQEPHPATPAPEPTPEPLPNTPAPTGPAETGNDNGGAQPPADSGNTGTTIPNNGDPDPQG